MRFWLISSTHTGDTPSCSLQGYLIKRNALAQAQKEQGGSQYRLRPPLSQEKQKKKKIKQRPGPVSYRVSTQSILQCCAERMYLSSTYSLAV